jgi:hypothetical protein
MKTILNFGSFPGSDGLRFVREGTERHHSADRQRYPSSPFPRSFVPVYPADAASIVFPQTFIPLVFARRSGTEIYKSIVSPIVVYMVNLLVRELAGHIKPGKAMSKIKIVVDRYLPVTMRILGASYAANS